MSHATHATATAAYSRRSSSGGSSSNNSSHCLGAGVGGDCKDVAAGAGLE
jgi:hypothetical protein